MAYADQRHPRPQFPGVVLLLQEIHQKFCLHSWTSARVDVEIPRIPVDIGVWAGYGQTKDRVYVLAPFEFSQGRKGIHLGHWRQFWSGGGCPFADAGGGRKGDPLLQQVSIQKREELLCHQERASSDSAGYKTLSGWGHSSGAVWESRWTSWAVRPDEPSGFRGRKELLNRASALVTTCP